MVDNTRSREHFNINVATYDALNRPHETKITVNSIIKTATNTYDANGNQLTMTDETGTTTRTYDEENRCKTKTVPNIGTSTYEYDIITGVEDHCVAETSTDPKGNVTRKEYDRAGRLHKVTTDGRTTTYAYDDKGRRTSVTYHDGAKEEYTYYTDDLLHTLTNKKADGTIIDAYAYTYDAAHNQTSKTDAKGTTSYTYDELNRLKTVTEPGGKVTTYTYDKAGNRATETITQGGGTTITTYNYNEQNRLTGTATTQNGQTIQTISYTYDNNGNQLTQETTPYEGGIPQTPVTVLNTYDELNRLVTVTTADSITIDNTYNGDGQRTAKTVNGQTTRYLYEYDKVILELDNQNNEKARNVYGTNLIKRTVDGETYHYMYNGHGDVTALLDAEGNISAAYYYDAFGNITETVGEAVYNPYTYAGYRYDSETGLYYLNARYYDSRIARFISEDTYRGKKSDPLTLNLYTYCHNNPIMYVDLTGHWAQGDENLTYTARVEISRLTDLYYAAKSKDERDAIHKAANDIRNNPANKASTPQNSVTGQKANEILSSKSADARYMSSSEWSSISTTKNDAIVRSTVSSGSITQDKINAVATSKPSNVVNVSSPTVSTNNATSNTAYNSYSYGYYPYNNYQDYGSVPPQVTNNFTSAGLFNPSIKTFEIENNRASGVHVDQGDYFDSYVGTVKGEAKFVVGQEENENGTKVKGGKVAMIPGLDARAGVQASVIEIDASTPKLGVDNANIAFQGEGNVFTADAYVGFTARRTSTGFRAGAEASVVSVEGSTEINIFGLRVKVGVEGSALSIGAKADYTADLEKGKIRAGAKAALGLGGGLYFEVGWK